MQPARPRCVAASDGDSRGAQRQSGGERHARFDLKLRTPSTQALRVRTAILPTIYGQFTPTTSHDPECRSIVLSGPLHNSTTSECLVPPMTAETLWILSDEKTTASPAFKSSWYTGSPPCHVMNTPPSSVVGSVSNAESVSVEPTSLCLGLAEATRPVAGYSMQRTPRTSEADFSPSLLMSQGAAHGSLRSPSHRSRGRHA